MGGGPFGFDAVLASAMGSSPDLTPPDVSTTAPPGGDMSGPTGGLPTDGSPGPGPGWPYGGQQDKLMQALQKLKALASGPGKMMTPGGKGGGSPYVHPGQPGVQIPGGQPAARMGQPFQQGTGPGSGLTPPVAGTPPRPGFQQTGTEGEFMSQLTPQAAALYQGLQSFHQLLEGRKQQNDQRDAAEASNVAKNLMQALDTAQNSPDQRAKADAMQTVQMILKNKEYSRVLDKVYKGWLQKADQQKKQKGKEQPVDPEQAGFEQGLKDFYGGKAQQAPQMPSTMAGYRLPAAGPAQQIGNISAQEQAQRAVQDPKTTMPSQLTSQEMRETELGAGPEKVQAEKAKAKAETDRAHADIIVAGSRVQEEQAKLATKQAETKYAETLGKKAEAIKDIDYRRALVNLDIAREKYKLAQIPKQKGQPPPNLISQVTAGQNALDYIDKILADPKLSKKGLQANDVEMLRGLLPRMGASGLVKNLPQWWQMHAPTWLGGDGTEDVQSMRDSIQYQVNGLSTTIQERFKDWDGPGSIKAQGGVLPSAGAFDESGGEEEPGGGVASPEEDIGLPPGFNQPPRNE